MSETVTNEKADLGIVEDPDVDRLAFVCENGKVFGEEYTLVVVSDHLSRSPGNTVSNLSFTSPRDVTEKHGGKYFASAVGEVNVVNMMKEKTLLLVVKEMEGNLSLISLRKRCTSRNSIIPHSSTRRI